MRLRAWFDHESGEYVVLLTRTDRSERRWQFAEPSTFLAHLETLEGEGPYEAWHVTGPHGERSFAVCLRHPLVRRRDTLDAC